MSAHASGGVACAERANEGLLGRVLKRERDSPGFFFIIASLQDRGVLGVHG